MCALMWWNVTARRPDGERSRPMDRLRFPLTSTVVGSSALTSRTLKPTVSSMALATKFEPEWAVAAHNAAMKKLIEALVSCNVTKSSGA
ncbi:protein of unknown function [Burkholderia multivorans]